MKKQILVITVIDSAVDQVKSFENIEGAKVLFVEICRKNVNHFDEYSEKEFESIMEYGYEQWGDNNSVCIYHL